jgi:hypothetical protein
VRTEGRAEHREGRTGAGAGHGGRPEAGRAAPLGDLAGEPSLTHRGLHLVHLAFAPGSLGDADTWYVPDARFWFGRASRPERFSAALRSGGEEVLAVEIPEGRWGESADFVARLGELTAQLVDAGIVRRDRTPLDARQTFVRGVYPMYRRGWRGRWDVAMARVAETGRVLPAGRQGQRGGRRDARATSTCACGIERRAQGCRLPAMLRWVGRGIGLPGRRPFQ